MPTEKKPFTDFIHRFVPAAHMDANTPTLLMLHGTGGNEDDLLDLGHALVPGAALLSPRGQVLENGMPRFFRRLAEGVLDVEDIKRRTPELTRFVAAACNAYQLNPAHVIAAGFSNGANIAASILLLDPSVLAGALLFHAMVPLEPETLPQLAGTPVFLGAGRADPLVSVQQTEHLATLLQQAGADVTIHWHNGGHTITREELRGAKSWLQQHASVLSLPAEA